MTREESVIACDTTVFSPEERDAFTTRAAQLLHKVQDVQALPDGYAFRFANEPGAFMALADFVEHERQCCPFYHLTLEATPHGGPLWLRLTGGDEVKAYVQTTCSEMLGAHGVM